MLDWRTDYEILRFYIIFWGEKGEPLQAIEEYLKIYLRHSRKRRRVSSVHNLLELVSWATSETTVCELQNRRKKMTSPVESHGRAGTSDGSDLN